MRSKVLSLLVLLAALTVTYAGGSSATVSWVAPAAYGDGSALPATDIAFYTISWQPAAGSSGVSGSVKVTSGTSTVVNVPCGGTSFSATVTTTASAKYPNETSSPTGPVAYASGITCAPNPPSGLAVQ